jgi:hypothetical protein
MDQLGPNYLEIVETIDSARKDDAQKTLENKAFSSQLRQK